MCGHLGREPPTQAGTGGGGRPHDSARRGIPRRKRNRKEAFSGKRLYIFYFSMAKAHMQGGNLKKMQSKIGKKGGISVRTLHILNMDSRNASCPSFLRRWAEGQACGPLPGCGTQAVSRRRTPAEGAPPLRFLAGGSAWGEECGQLKTQSFLS